MELMHKKGIILTAAALVLMGGVFAQTRNMDMAEKTRLQRCFTWVRQACGLRQGKKK